ncbi:hypothetical protein [Haladaptatus halobius]|uniref:hypothetical protein n=1 Tax=Haladaptatus halobius TaxID=2884875 RepID=UPI001D0AE80D|nr:hypothetical protein [Haladaptatus halobius]
MTMNRIAVLGTPGAGKSTFAKRLGERLDVPVAHLDAHFWEPGWEKPETSDWEATHRELMRPESWILDGNYGSTIDARLEAADTAILLDIPRHICLCRVLERWLRNRGQTRPDMADGCVEKIDIEFLRYTWNFAADKIPKMERKFERQGEELTVVRLRSNEEREAFLERLRDE